MPAGQHGILWDTTDDDSIPVHSGIYNARIVIGNAAETTVELFVVVNEPNEFLVRPNAITNAEGAFLVSLEIMPLSETLLYGDEEFMVSRSASLTTR